MIIKWEHIMSDSSTCYKLADSVLHRLVQIVQEGILMGIDVADLLREIKLVPDTLNESTLVLTKEYVEHVETSHKQYLNDVSERSQINSVKINDV